MPGSTDPGTERSTYRRRPFALALNLYGFVWACVWLAFPMVVVAIFFVVGGPAVPWWAAVWMLTIGATFFIPGVTGLLHALDRVRWSMGDPILLEVGPDGLWLRGAGRLGWTQIAGIRAGNIDIVRSPHDFGGIGQRLEVVPRESAYLAGQPWFAVVDQRIRGAVRRLKPLGDRTPLRAGLQLDLDLLDTPPRDVFAAIARFRPTDGQPAAVA